MVIRVILFLSILSLALFLYKNFIPRIMVLKSGLNAIVSKINNTEKIVNEEIKQNVKDQKKEVEKKIENGKLTIRSVVVQSLDKKYKPGEDVLGIKTSKNMQINNIKIDYNRREIIVPLDLIGLENIELLKNSSVIKIFITDLKSDKSDITGNFITIDAEQISGTAFAKTIKGNPLELHLSNTQTNNSEVIIRPVMIINLPPGVYEGVYTGSLHVEVCNSNTRCWIASDLGI